MNYQSHLQRIRTDILTALTYEKPRLIERFIAILQTASKLLGDDILFKFWLEELINNDPHMIPITKHAVVDCVGFWLTYVPSRQSLRHNLNDTCEKLFTYWEHDDLCDFQGQFHYYKNKKNDVVFKDSVLGNTELLTQPIDFHNNFELGSALIGDLEKLMCLNNLYK